MQDGTTVRPGAWRSLVQVFWNPGQVMAVQAERPAIWPAYLVAMLVTAGAALAMTLATRDLGMAEIVRQLQARGQGAPTPDMVQALWVAGVLSAVVGAGIKPWLGGAITALVLMLCGALRGGAEGFRKYFAVAGYAGMPLVLGAIVQVPLVRNAGSMEQLQHIGLGPVAFFPQAQGALLGALQSLDMFGLWGLALLVIGFAAVHRMPVARAAWVGILLLLLRVVLGAGAGALGGLFGQAA